MIKMKDLKKNLIRNLFYLTFFYCLSREAVGCAQCQTDPVYSPNGCCFNSTQCQDACYFYGQTKSPWYFTEGNFNSYKITAYCVSGCGELSSQISLNVYSPPGELPSGLTPTPSGESKTQESLTLLGTPAKGSAGYYSATISANVNNRTSICLPITIQISASAPPTTSASVVDESATVNGPVVLTEPVTARAKKMNCNKKRMSQWVNQIKIKPPIDGVPPSSFRVYRKGRMVFEFPNSGKNVKFTQPNRNLRKLYVYYVHSVDPNGIESAPSIAHIKGTRYLRKQDLEL